VRILQLNTYADPMGGAEVYALSLAQELRARGHVVGFFGTSPDREVDEADLRIVRRPAYDARLLWGEPAVRAAFEAFARRLRPELVHVHNVFSLGLDLMEALGGLGVPTIQTVHDFNRVCPNSWCVRGDGSACAGGIGAQCFEHDCKKNYPFDAAVALHALLRHRALLQLVDLSICPSQCLADRLRSHGQQHVVHVPNAVDPIPIPPGLSRDEHALLYVGRLTPEKGVDYLLEAMPALRAWNPLITLTVAAGGSPSPASIQRLRRVPGVTVMTSVPRHDLGRLYATASACILPSIWSENAPLVAFECLAAGLPMIASRVGGLPELVQDGVSGFTFEPRDVRDLVEKARRFLSLGNAERDRMARSMQARSADYRLGPHLAKIEGLYSQVAALERAPIVPATPLDADFRALIREQTREKALLDGSLNERVFVLQPKSAERGARRRAAMARIRRVARTLRLPKVFPG
jgi:glycosyltransferase involved in cell wall biosynthesis